MKLIRCLMVALFVASFAATSCNDKKSEGTGKGDAPKVNSEVAKPKDTPEIKK